MCKVYTGYHGTSEIEHGLCTCTVGNPLAKARDYLSIQAHKPRSISHLNICLASLSCRRDKSLVCIFHGENTEIIKELLSQSPLSYLELNSDKHRTGILC